MLREMAKVPCDSAERPLRDIVITRTSVYANPFSAEEMHKEQEEAAAKERVAQEEVLILSNSLKLSMSSSL